MQLGNLDSIPDLSKLSKVKHENVRIFCLLDGTRIVTEVLSESDEVINVNMPLRIMVRPIESDRISIELLEYAMCAKQGAKLSLFKSAVAMRYEVDEKLYEGYRDHLSKSA